jgi:hypothetical protein
MQYSMQCVSNVFIKMMEFEAGDVEHLHSHMFDHTQVLASGKMKVTIEDQETIYTAPKLIFIAKDMRHKLEAIEPSVALCVHALRNGYGVEDIVDPDAIPDGTFQSTIGKLDKDGKRILPLAYVSKKLDSKEIETVYCCKP